MWAGNRERWHRFYFSDGKEMLRLPMLIAGYLSACEPTEEVFILVTALFSIFWGFFDLFFIEAELSKKGKPNGVPLQKPYLIRCRSWGCALVYHIPGLDSAYVPVWYWETPVKYKAHKNFPIFKQTNKHQWPQNPAGKVSSSFLLWHSVLFTGNPQASL